MKHWEIMNELANNPESLEEQAIKLYSYQLVDAIEHSGEYGDMSEALDAGK